jgi:hypothetical protein
MNRMLVPEGRGMRFCGVVLLGVLLAGCAARPPEVVAVTATPVVAARLHQGIVVGVRTIDMRSDPGARPGVDAVLTDLRSSPSPAAVSAQEIVVQEVDNGAVSIVAPPAPAFAVGDHVTIAEGGTTALVRN